MSVKNMAEASQTAAEWKPIPVSTPGGTIYVGKLKWPVLKRLWRDIQGLIGDGVRAWNAYATDQEARSLLRQSVGLTVRLVKDRDGEEYQALDASSIKSITDVTYELHQKAGEGFAVSIDAIVLKAGEVPGLIEQVVVGACKRESEEGEMIPMPAGFCDDLDGDLVIKLFKLALEINYSDNPEAQAVQDFFGGATQLFQGKAAVVGNVTTTETTSE